MKWNEQSSSFGATSAVKGELGMTCVLFADDADRASDHCAVLEEHGIFAQLGHAQGGPGVVAGLGVPVLVAPTDQERASMILATLEASAEEDWDEGDADLESDEEDDDFDDEDDDDLFEDDDDDDDYDDDEDDDY